MRQYQFVGVVYVQVFDTMLKWHLYQLRQVVERIHPYCALRVGRHKRVHLETLNVI
jgi:hypothetical protein